MKLAFCLLHYFPFGGLQRDFLNIAYVLSKRGHAIHVYTLCWENPPPPPWLSVHLINTSAWQNHVRLREFIHQTKPLLAQAHYSAVIGFNKMPDLDIYYAADVCYADRLALRPRSWCYRWLPHYQQLLHCERAVFRRGQKTKILLIAPSQKKAFIQHYQTEEARFYLLPPGITRNTLSLTEAAAIRQKIRCKEGLSDQKMVIVLVGSSFQTKGLDRLLYGIAALPIPLKDRCQLLVIGQGRPAPFIKLAKHLKISEKVRFLGGCHHVNHFLFAADLLAHPAYVENTGTVLLEALAAGLPVLTLDHCGYAFYVSAAQAGMVLASPFQQSLFNQALEKMLHSLKESKWQQNALAFTHISDLYHLPDYAADFIENVGR